MDKDLSALQETRDLLNQASTAADALAHMSPEAAWAVAEAVAAALLPKAEFYAEWAVRESRIGKVADKVLKNRMACLSTMEGWRGVPLGGVRRDDAHAIIEIGRPAGVIVGLSNSTSPVATIIFKSLMALMTRNAIVFSPHPVALQCCGDAVREIQTAAQRAGAPAHAVQMLTQPTMEATNAMMRDARCNLIVATGGTPMVRAAYASGNPTIGVGSGNVPVYVDRSADIAALVPKLLVDKNFDHGSPCSAPSVLLVDRPAVAAMRDALTACGAYMCSADEAARVQAHVWPGGKFNGKVVGRPAAEIASGAGLVVGGDTPALVLTLEKPEVDHPLLREKLSPILTAVVVDGVDEAIAVARMMLMHSGAGHTAGIHTASAEQAVYFGAALDYHRVIVNGGTVFGSTGDETGLPFTFTIGTGFAGKSSVDCNVGADMLVNWKRVAFPLPGGWLGTRGRENLIPTTPTRASNPSRETNLDAGAELLHLLAEELERAR
ncbi:aldehyde dehydrogenase family protein [Variovorax sp. LT1P1]|uniref:aldehyde dehydrogenase family protein n=1 Tax=Variovorax sp. LT1P1 TaxID=3443730 RepID=UPI003F47D257